MLHFNHKNIIPGNLDNLRFKQYLFVMVHKVQNISVIQWQDKSSDFMYLYRIVEDTNNKMFVLFLDIFIFFWNKY